MTASMFMGRGATPFGTAELVWSPRGVRALAFVDDSARAVGHAARDDAAAAQMLAEIFAQPANAARVAVELNGTAFQRSVWALLKEIPPGAVWTYGQLARALGQPGASRAVGTAMAANTIAVLVPCHRVVRAGGHVGQYRWGPHRKRALLAWERVSALRA